MITVEEKAALDSMIVAWRQFFGPVAERPYQNDSEYWLEDSWKHHVGKLIERKELAESELARLGHEPIGESYHVREGFEVCTQGPVGDKSMVVTLEHKGYGFKVAKALKLKQARELAALLIWLADGIESRGAPYEAAAPGGTR